MTAQGFGEIAERLRRSTVQVQVPGRWRGAGSGVISSPDGMIVTNAHVARSPNVAVELWDSRRMEATVIRTEPRRDLALLKAEATDLPPATFGDSNALRVGELVIAVGNPFGFQGALSTGVVHAVHPYGWVQADVRLAPGNSGGPLADAQGRVIGINTMVAGGLALAVPSNTVAEFLNQRAPRASLGVVLRPIPLRPGPEPALGMLILEVAPGGPAAASSLLTGDVLIAADGAPFRSVTDLARALDGTHGVLKLQFLRGDQRTTREVAVQLAQRGSEAA